jgi:hypothetical protein
MLKNGSMVTRPDWKLATVCQVLNHFLLGPGSWVMILIKVLPPKMAKIGVYLLKLFLVFAKSIITLGIEKNANFRG